jgi:hypothetical protein
MQIAPEVLTANQKVTNEVQHQSNLQSTPVPGSGTLDFENTLMGQQESHMRGKEQEKHNQQEQQELHQQQEPMEVVAPGQEQHQHLQQLDQQQNYFNVGNLNNQQLEDTYPQYQQQHQQIQSVNQHELIQQQQERAVSGI